MKTKTIETFTYDELNADAQEKARDWFREHKLEHYAWSSEALASLKALAEAFDGKLGRYEIDFTGDYGPSFAEFDMPEMAREKIMRRLSELGSYDDATLKGKGDCKLTGYAMDESALDGFRVAAFAGESLSDCMDAAFSSWLKDCKEDCREENSDEAIAEAIRDNNYAFTVDGKRSVVL